MYVLVFFCSHWLLILIIVVGCIYLCISMYNTLIFTECSCWFSSPLSFFSLPFRMVRGLQSSFLLIAVEIARRCSIFLGMWGVGECCWYWSGRGYAPPWSLLPTTRKCWGWSEAWNTYGVFELRDKMWKNQYWKRNRDANEQGMQGNTKGTGSFQLFRNVDTQEKVQEKRTDLLQWSVSPVKYGSLWYSRVNSTKLHWALMEKWFILEDHWFDVEHFQRDLCQTAFFQCWSGD